MTSLASKGSAPCSVHKASTTHDAAPGVKHSKEAP